MRWQKYPYDKRNVSIIQRILKDEQPVTETYLSKRLAKVLGFGHTGANIQRAVSAAVPKLYQDPISVGGTYSFWLNKKSARNYSTYRAPSPRSITEIPAVEIANAIKEVIKEEFSLPKEKIPTIAARKLGFYSAGAKICETINAVIAILEKEAVITQHNGLVSFSATT